MLDWWNQNCLMVSVMDFAVLLAKATDSELEAITRDYLWLAIHGLEGDRGAFQQRRDACIIECLGRGKGEILGRATRIPWVRHDGKPSPANVRKGILNL
jgi:hypothetical protein